VIVPGLLTYLIIKFKKELPSFGKLALIVCFSILELIVTALAINSVLPLFGIIRPLDPAFLSLGVAILVFGLLLILWPRLANWEISLENFSVYHFNRLDWFACLFPLVFVVMSIMGALSLNNGGTNALTLIMLAAMALYFFWLVVKGKSLKSDAITISIYLIGLSLLLMTSLRGWYTTGHDIQQEFYVFKLAKDFGVWNIGYYKEAYNACLSITLLPTIFANLLHFSDPYVYKVCFQLIFAFTPSVVFLITQRYLKPEVAIITCIWFMAFPTYFTDMPMLNRQEIAFLFLSLMIWVVFEPGIKASWRKWLFLIFGSSIAALHYSTMYSVITILSFSVGLRWVLLAIKSIRKQKRLLKQSAIYGLSHKKTFQEKPLLTFPILIIFIATSVIWGGLITQTSSNVSNIAAQTIVNIPYLFDKDTRSGNVLYSLFSWKKIDSNQRLKQYIDNDVKQIRGVAPQTFFDDSIVNKYPITLAEESTLPLSKAGLALKGLGVNVFSFNFAIRQSSAKLVQLLIIIGFGYLIFRKRRFIKKKVDTEFALFAAGSLLFIFLLLVLPVVSTAYGLLRGFLQALMVLGLFLVAGSLTLTIRLQEKKRIIFACLLACAFFLSTTGFISQIIGGYLAPLHLNNSGSYYDQYYLHRGEILGLQKLGIMTPKSITKTDLAQFDAFELNKIMNYESFYNLFSLDYIFPAIIKKDSFVFLGPQNLRGQSTLSYSGDDLVYSYPLDFLDNEKDLIYSNSQVKVYK